MIPVPPLPTCVYCGAQTWLDGDGLCGECALEGAPVPAWVKTAEWRRDLGAYAARKGGES